MLDCTTTIDLDDDDNIIMTYSWLLYRNKTMRLMHRYIALQLLLFKTINESLMSIKPVCIIYNKKNSESRNLRPA